MSFLKHFDNREVSFNGVISASLRVEAAVCARNRGVSANFHSSSGTRCFSTFLHLYMATLRSL